ncbi:MAG: pilus assembly protein PilM [Deltaproteobacteria bacterium]|nr:pilus assembly protein PilM [Deltaproteobacteria bacterium]
MAQISVGIDIGSKNVKVVCVEPLQEGYRLVAYGFYSYRGDAGRLRKVFRHHPIRSRDIRINIEDPSLKIRRVDLPPIPDSEWDRAVPWAVKDVIDGEVEDFVFRWAKIDSQDVRIAGKVSLMVFAIRRSAAKNRIRRVRESGLPSPQVVEPDVGALASIFDFCRGAQRDRYEVLMDVGNHLSFFVVMGKGGMIYSRPLSHCADEDLNRQLERDLGLPAEKAIEGKQQYMKEGTFSEDFALDGRLKNTISHFYSRMAIEIQRSVDGFALLFEHRPIDHIYLCGGGAYYRGLIDYLTSTLGIPVSLFDPFQKIDTESFPGDALASRKALFAVACGLAVDG